MAKKSEGKSGRKPGGWAADPSKRGRGPAKGAPNAGRPRLAVKALAASLLERNQLLEEVAKIATGEVGEALRDAQGNELRVYTSKPNERIAAVKLLLSYAEGLPTQRVETLDMGIERPRVVLPPIADDGEWTPGGAA